MAKVNPQKGIQKQRSKDELDRALQAFCTGVPVRSIPPQVDDSDIVLADGIAELMEARAGLADLQMWMQQWLARSARR